ncbi:MAG: PD-(D/E)XK nuclease family protein [Ignavibacteriaceae bacterium]
MILTKSDKDKVNIDELIYEKINSNNIHELLLIVPTNRKIRYLKRELISSAPLQALSDLNLETLSTLTTKLFNEFRNFKAKILSDAAAVVLLNKSFSEVKLQYFNSYKKEIPRGTLELLKNVISEYKRHGIGPDEIRKESSLLTGSEKYKAIDISNIYSVYQDKTKELNVYEQGDIYEHLIKISNQDFSHTFDKIFPGVSSIIIIGFDEFSEPEINLINRMSDLTGNSLFLSFDYFKYNPEIFSHLVNCYKSFIHKNFKESEDRSTGSIDDFRKTVREKLFTEARINPKESNLKLIKTVSSNPIKEIETIAKEIKRLLLSEEARADEICVSFNRISEHSAIIRDVFDNYGIPFNLTDRYSLSNSQPVIAIVNFLEILENDFYYKNIFRALNGRWIVVPGVDLSNLLLVSANLKLVTGYNNWINSIDSVLEQIQNIVEYEENGYLQHWKYENAKRDIIRINDLLNPFRKKQTLNSFRDNLVNFISFVNLPSKIINEYSINIEKNVKAITVFIEIIEELFDLLEDEYGSSKTFSISFFLHQIKTALAFSRYNIKERHDSGVLVTSVNEIRGLRFRYLFLGGMTDGEFPTRFQPAIFFSGEHKNRRSEHRHLLEERYRFYQALCVPEKCLFVSYPANGEKKEFSESTFITDLEKLFLVESKNDSEFAELIYSKDELLKAIGKKEIEVNQELSEDADKIEEAIGIDKLRTENPFAESPYTGFINKNLSKEAVEKLSSFKLREYSASQLEDYAKCPFRYFVSRVLLLETIEEPTEEMEAFEIGSLIHSILYKFYTELRKKDILLNECTDKEFKSAEKLLFEIAEEKVNKIKFISPASFFEREKIFGINGNKANSILHHFLLAEKESEKGYSPEYFEYAFGNFSGNTTASNIAVNSINLRGKVDRIDLNKDVQSFKVIDYKLGGKKPAKDDLLNGISLQLPLYMYASKKLIEAEMNDKFNPAAAEIYSLKLTQKDFGRKPISISSSRNLSDDERIKMNENIIEIAIESITLYVSRIINGDFSLSQLEDRESKVCSYCEFKSICRIQEVK